MINVNLSIDVQGHLTIEQEDVFRHLLKHGLVSFVASQAEVFAMQHGLEGSFGMKQIKLDGEIKLSST